MLIPSRRQRGIIAVGNMAARTCVLLALVCACAARECIELTIADDNIFSSTISNGTILKVAAHNESYESSKINVLDLWDRFPRIMVPVNGTSEQCRRDSRLFYDSLDRLELWALKSNYSLFTCL